MEYVFLGIVVFLFLLAVFDLSVGVSNDAANFLNSAIGARAASFRTVIFIAAVGVFLGAVMSNGMMDIARHGVFRPEQFSFFDLICIFMAVMVTDIILLDVFNSLGLPTSTTVSMIFGLLGATFAVSLFKLASDSTGLSMGDLLNTEKALSMIIGIFLSVAVAFVFGTVVQYLSRLWFSFDYRSGLTWKIGLFGGIAITAIIYFLLIKGIKDLSFMTPALKEWIHHHTGVILLGCFVVSTGLCQFLNFIKVNVFKVVILTGTFALAMAFAGNDLVNFIGVPLSGLASYNDFAASGGGNPHSFTMDSLNAPASTPIYFLIGAGIIMIIALATSKKAQKVVNTSLHLARQNSGESAQGIEMFGSSRLSRRLVRWTLSVSEWVLNHTPAKIRKWAGRRLDPDKAIIENGAAFDLVRGSINLVLAGALIAMGTSLKLPLSTTYVTFMVAMGSSLADRAWGRESAVFRITGVISVIGGWFITAGIAFIGAALVVSLMHLGGVTVMAICAVATIALILHRNFRRRKEETKNDSTLFQAIISSDDPVKSWELLRLYMTEHQLEFLDYALTAQKEVTGAFLSDNHRVLGKYAVSLARHKAILKNNRRNATLCFKHIPKDIAIEKNTWFYLAGNCQISMLYNLLRIAEVCYEHVDNNFRPLPEKLVGQARAVCSAVSRLLEDAVNIIRHPDTQATLWLRRQCDQTKDLISAECRLVYGYIREEKASDMGVLYVYLNLLQEQQEMTSNLRKLLRADFKLMSDKTESLSVYEHA